MATEADALKWFSERLSSEIGVELPEVWLDEIWQNNTGKPVPQDAPVFFPGDRPDKPSGLAREDIVDGGIGRIRKRIQPKWRLPADHICLDVDIYPDGGRGVHSVSVSTLARIFAPALPDPPPAGSLSQAEFDALLAQDEAGQHGFRRYLLAWRERGLI